MALPGRRRQWQGLTAGLGLFALVLQLMVSFGHIHPTASLTATSTAGLASSAAGERGASDQQQSPAQHPEDDCLICLAMHMAASGLQPSPPAIFVSFQVSEVLPQEIIERFEFGAPRHVLFQTRAPPTA